jgi:TonB family protein
LAAERIESVRLEAQRQEQARQAAATQESQRQAAAQQEAARRAEAKLEEAAAREAKLRAIGRQLNEEAERREAQAPSTRRGRIFGRADTNAELLAYAEAWSRKIQLNMAFDLFRDLIKQPHKSPLVTVSMRSDGTVEEVRIVTSSGVPAIDEAVRRAVQGQAPYPAFPPALLRDFDVIEIRRTWVFDSAIRMY